MASNNLTHNDYTVGWVCALSKEQTAATAMLDERHADLLNPPNDHNTYTLGCINKHNIVIACLPEGEIGNNAAAVVTTRMASTFPSIRFGMLVGIGGGVPPKVRLGDVVISTPSDGFGGVVQWDLGKAEQGDTFKRTGNLSSPPSALRTVLTKLKTTHEMGSSKISQYLDDMKTQWPKLAAKYTRSESLHDVLFRKDYNHVEKHILGEGGFTDKGGAASEGNGEADETGDENEEDKEDEEDESDMEKGCTCCDLSKLVKRRPRDMRVHYGLIASGNQVIKDAAFRDMVNKSLGGDVLCFEMEAAGLMNDFPCIVVRGICDYADSHKNKAWQEHAAAVAAAFAKEFLFMMPVYEVDRLPAIKDIIGRIQKLTTDIADIKNSTIDTEEERILVWLSSSNFSQPQNNAQRSRTLGTGEWLLKRKEYTNWRGSEGLLWLYGVSGCGKSILCSTVIDDLRQLCKLDPRKRIAYWYFQFSNVNTQSVCSMLQSLLRQLCSSPLDISIRSLCDQHQKPGSKPSTKDLMKTIWSIIDGLEQDVFIVIDALDECPLPERRELLDHINELRNGGNTKVHILATSRREPDIDAKLKEPPTVAVNIEHLIEGDIKLFVHAALLKDEKLSRWDEDSKSLIREKLTTVDETRFRWADLQIKRLQSCREKSELIDALNTVPESLEKTYEEALEKVPAKDEKRVQKILMWLTSSFRPMTLEEIAAVVSFPFAADVLELCTSLLVTLIDGEVNQTIKLAHFSVKEYLILTTQGEGLSSWYRFKNEIAQAIISEMAVTYLLDPNEMIRSGEKVMPSSLLKYSAEFWPWHAAEAFNPDDPSITSELQAQIDLLFSSSHSPRYFAWLKIHNPDERFTFSRTHKQHYPQPLYYASLLGLRLTVEILLEKGCRITMDEGASGNALNAAAIHGYFEIVKCLGKYHAKIGSIADIPRIAGRIKKNAERTFALFLSEESETVISHDVVKAAAGN